MYVPSPLKGLRPSAWNLPSSFWPPVRFSLSCNTVWGFLEPLLHNNAPNANVEMLALRNRPPSLVPVTYTKAWKTLKADFVTFKKSPYLNKTVKSLLLQDNHPAVALLDGDEEGKKMQH